jgi:hypothetical protein
LKRIILIVLIFLYFTSIISVNTVLAAESSISIVTLPNNQHLALNSNSVTFQLDQENGPLTIKFQAYPNMITDEKWVFNGPGDTVGKSVIVTRPNEFSRFTITLKNKNSGKLLLEEGYGSLYSISLEPKQFIIRENGPYVVTLSGQQIEIDIDISSSSVRVTDSPTIRPSSSITPVKTPSKIPPGSSPGIISKLGIFFTNPILISIILLMLFIIFFAVYTIRKKDSKDINGGDTPSVGSIPMSGKALATDSDEPPSAILIEEHHDDIHWLIDRIKTASDLDKNRIEELLVSKGNACVDPLINALPSEGELPELRELIYRILARIGDQRVEKMFLHGLVDRNQTIRFWAHYGIRESVGGFS